MAGKPSSLAGKGFGYVVLIESSTRASFHVQFDKNITGTIRFMVF